ncbi:MAG: SurA N-terminal domain-containing protein [Ardenticatenaceae bacterium]|nr:SurA N-terminal domain-containing protein [Ardenticatenaceae bacterium]
MLHKRIFILILPCLLLLAACSNDESASPTAVSAPSEAVEAITVESVPTVVPTETAVPPTPTPTEPLAALVNNEPITIATFERELARYEQAQSQLGQPVDDNSSYRQLVLDALIERKLITQSAAMQGVAVTPEMVDTKLNELRAAAGEAGNFEAWLEANQWTEAEFREALQVDMLVEAMVAKVTENVPATTAQVHARYIQLDDPTLAQTVLADIRNGADFAAMAQQHSLDRVTGEAGGDLGFFARGSLLVPAVEEAAFALAPNAVSDVVTVTDDNGATTYYLVQQLEVDEERPLTPAMRSTLLQQTFADWLAQLWAQANISRFI